ncbi:MAG: uncharacterized protein QG610_1820 [Euryarchaeota archaeon]|nr:uncharacterized protein [Euryarchaeota archaeon]
MQAYEGREALRFNELAVKMGVRGVRRVMESLVTLHVSDSQKRKSLLPVISRSSVWIRAPKSKIFHQFKTLGNRAREGEILGFVVDPFGRPGEMPIKVEDEGILIGKNNLPLANEGNVMFHIARFEKIELIKSQFEELRSLKE